MPLDGGGFRSHVSTRSDKGPREGANWRRSEVSNQLSCRSLPHTPPSREWKKCVPLVYGGPIMNTLTWEPHPAESRSAVARNTSACNGSAGSRCYASPAALSPSRYLLFRNLSFVLFCCNSFALSSRLSCGVYCYYFVYCLWCIAIFICFIIDLISLVPF